jgi:outer membrane protein
MGASERANAEKEFRELQREVNRLGTELEEDVNLRRNEELGKLQRSILDAVNVFAQSNEYDMVFADGVIYASENMNITGLILESLQNDPQDVAN